MEVMGGYSPLLEHREAKVAKRLKSQTPEKLYVDETLLEGLPQDLQDMEAKLGQFIQAEHAVVGARHLARPRQVVPPNNSKSATV